MARGMISGFLLGALASAVVLGLASVLTGPVMAPQPVVSGAAPESPAAASAPDDATGEAPLPASRADEEAGPPPGAAAVVAPATPDPGEDSAPTGLDQSPAPAPEAPEIAPGLAAPPATIDAQPPAGANASGQGDGPAGRPAVPSAPAPPAAPDDALGDAPDDAPVSGELE